MKKDRRFLIGLALTAFTGLLFFLVFSLDSTLTWVRGSAQVHISFANVQGLRTDDPVYFHGVPCGRVADVRFQPAGGTSSGPTPPGVAMAQGAAPTTMRVLLTLSLPQEVRDYLRTGSQASIEKTLTGITVVNLEQGDGAPLAAGQALTGIESVGLQQITEKLDASSATISTVLEDVQSIVAECKREGFVTEIFASLREVSRQGTELVESMQTILDENRQGFRSLTESGAAATRRVDEVVERVDGLVRDIDGALDGVPGLLHDVDGAVNEAQVVFRDTKHWIRDLRPNVDSTVEDLARTADDLATLSTDLRHRPWRLLHAPGKEEVKELELFQTATQYSRGATELRRTVDRLSRALVGQEDDPRLASTLEELLESLDTRLSRHAAFEKALWDRMMEGPE